MRAEYEGDQQRAAIYDQGRLIGKCVYEDRGDYWVIVTTKVDPAYGGQGLGRKLVAAVASAAAASAERLAASRARLPRHRGSDMESVTPLNFSSSENSPITPIATCGAVASRAS